MDCNPWEQPDVVCDLGNDRWPFDDDSVDEAINHVRQFGSGHTEAIITKDLESADRFVRELDSAVVMVNASTRFTDGEEFGYGAEIGISTQKLHVRGPMGLEALTCERWMVHGSGQIR